METTVAAQTRNISNIIGDITSQDIVPCFSVKDPSKAMKSLLERRKPHDKDALQAVKLDPAVLEAQVTVDATTRPGEVQHDSFEALPTKRNLTERPFPTFEEVLSTQQAALLGLTPQQLTLLVAFVDTLRAQRLYAQKHLECAFCRNNGSPAAWCATHALRDRRRVRCPVLRALRCPRCGATGDRAHTLKYCPLNLFKESWSYP